MTPREKEKIIADKVYRLYALQCRIVTTDNDIDKDRTRHEYNRDYARLIYSSAFRRLQGKMQLLGIDSGRYYRNRLTHSIEVAQIARSICINLARKYKRKFWSFSDLFLIETISLAHDIGNPPFGHAGEKILDNLANDIGGFEGNAQTYRLLRHTERKYRDIEGLNLTKRTMLGIVKYCQPRIERYMPFKKKKNDKFLYDNDYSEVLEIKKEYEINDQQTIDCQVLDLADEIAYGAHDLEDSLHQRLINVYDLLFLFKREIQTQNILSRYTSDQIQMATSKLESIIEDSIKYANGCMDGDSDDIFETILRKELASKIVDVLINDIDYDEHADSLQFINYKALADGLKKLLFNAIKNDSEKILIYERVGQNVITKLYDIFMDDHFNKNNALLSSSYRIFNYATDRKRKVIDYISGMMDSFSVEIYSQFTGKDPFKEIHT